MTGLQEYTTPDGRRIQLPQQLAQGMIGLSPVQPPEEVGAPPPAPAGALPGVQLPPPVSVDTSPLPTAPPESPIPVMPTPPERSPEPPAPPAPKPKPMTDADLSKVGYSGVLQQQNQAIDKEAEARQRAAEAEADAYTQQAAALEERNSETDKILVQRQAAAEQRMQSINAATVDAERAHKAYADHKVDTSLEHPVLAAISLALGAVGTAMRGGGEQNPALNVLMQQMDKRVQLQLAERDKLKDVAATKRQAIDAARVAGDDKIGMYNMAMAGETEKAIRKIEAIKAGSASETVRANADVMIAQLGEKKAGYLGEAVNRKVALDEQQAQRRQQAAQHAASIAEQRAGRAEGARQFDENLKFQREKEANDLRAAMAKNSSSSAAAAAKENEERGIRDPATGELLLNEQGRKMMDQAASATAEAEKLRAQASKVQDANGKAALEMRAKAAEEQAAALRGEAQVHAVRGRNAERADNVQKSLGSTQTALSLIDEIKVDARNAGTKVLNPDQIQTRLGTNIDILGLQLKEAWKLGTLDNGTVDYLNTLTGGDPSKLTRAGILGALGVGTTRGEQTIIKMDAIASSLERAAYNELSGLGVKGYRFKRTDDAAQPENKAAEDLLKEQTPAERGEGAKRGFLGQTFIDQPQNLARGAVSSLTGGEFVDAETARRQGAEASGSAKYPGLSTEQEKPMDTLLSQARGKGKSAEQARSKLVLLASDASRPGISNAVLTTLQANDPELYRQAVDRLPKDLKEQRLAGVQREEESRIRESEAIRSAPLYKIEKQALAGDDSARQELFRRHSNEPGSGATAAWGRVMQQMVAKRPR